MASLDLGTLVFKIQANNTDANKKIDETTDKVESSAKKMESVSKSLSKVGTVMSAAVTAPIIAAGVACVKYAADAEETVNKVDVVFEKNAASVKEWSESAIEKMGMAASTALDLASTFGDMGKGMGLSVGEATNMSVSLVQLAADMASFKNISIERAQTALNGVYTGETEALKGLGIVMTETNLTQFAMTQGITQAYNEMSQAEKVQLRYQYVMSVTSDAQGDFERTGGGVSNQLRKLKESLKETAANFGALLLPIINKVVTAINEFLKKLNSLDEGQKKTILTILAIVAAVGPILLMVSKVIAAINAVKNAVVAANVAMNASLGVVALVAAAIAGLIALVSALAANEKKLQEEAHERLIAKFDEATGSVEEFSKEIEAANEPVVTLKDRLTELAATDTDIDIRTNAPEVEQPIEDLKTFLGNLILGYGDLETAVEDANEALSEYEQAMINARLASTIDHIMTMIDYVHEGTMTQEEFNTAVNDSVANFNAYKDGVTGSTEGLKGLLTTFDGGTLSMETTNGILAQTSNITGRMGDEMNSATEGVSRLIQAETDGIITQEGYYITSQQTVDLMANEQLQAVTDVAAAYEQYNTDVQLANEKEQAEIAIAQEVVAAAQQKYDAATMYNSCISMGMTHIEALNHLETLYGTETKNAFVAAANEKTETAGSFYAASTQLAGQWSADVTEAENAQAEEAGAIAERKSERITQAETKCRETVNGVNVAWTDADILEFQRLAEESGLKLDEGFVNMLLSIDDFVLNSQSSFSEGGGLSQAAFKEGLDAMQENIDSVKETASGDGYTIGTNMATGIEAGIRDGTNRAVQAAIDAVAAAVEAAKNYSEVNSPSKKTAREIGKPLAEGVGVGFEKETPNIIKKLKNSIGNFTDSKIYSVSGKAKALGKAVTNNTDNSKVINQTNNFTSRELSPYEQQLKIRAISRAALEGVN